MTYCVIETGPVVDSLRGEYGSYPEMLIRLVDNHIPTGDFDIVSVVGGEPLPATRDYAGYVLMGSRYSVYDDVPWIDPLLVFAKHLAAEQIPQVGICFGHQLIAKAMGGRIAPSPEGWRVGNQVYRVSDPGSEAGGDVVAFSYHQDQVLDPPPHVSVIASSDTCPYGGLVYEQTPAFSVQFHPEFRNGFFRDLVAATAHRFPDPAFSRDALVNVERPTDAQRFAVAIVKALANEPAAEVVGALLGR